MFQKPFLFSVYVFIWMGFCSYLDIELQMFVLFYSSLIADLFCETSVLLRSGFSAKYHSLEISRELIWSRVGLPASDLKEISRYKSVSI